MKYLGRLFLSGIVFILLITISSAEKENYIQWKQHLSESITNYPVIAEVSGDAVPDVIVAGHSGLVTVFSGSDGKKHFSFAVDTIIQVSPLVIPDPFNSNESDLLIASQSGELCLINPRINKILWKLELQSPVVSGMAADLLQGKEKYVFFCDEEANLSCVDLNKHEVKWRKRLQAEAVNIPTLLKFNSDETQDVFVTLSNGMIYAFDGETGSSLGAMRISNQGVTSNPIFIQGDSGLLVVSADNGRRINTFNWGNEEPIKIPFIADEPFSLPLTYSSDFNRVVCISNDSKVYLYNPHNQKVIQDFAFSEKILTAPIWINTSKEHESLVVVSESGKISLLRAGDPNFDQITDIGEPVMGVLAGDVSNQGYMGIMIFTENKLILFNTKGIVDNGLISWPMYLANNYRTSQVNKSYAYWMLKRSHDNQRIIEGLYQEAISLKKQHNLDAALNMLKKVLESNPHHTGAINEIRKIQFGRNKPLINLIISSLVLIALLPVLLFYFKKKKKVTIQNIKKLLLSKDLDSVFEKHRKFIEKHSDKFKLELAIAYARKNIRDPEVLALYQSVYDENPEIASDNGIVIYQLAKGYASQNARDIGAVQLYRQALRFKADDVQIQEELALALMENKQFKDAIPLLEKLKDIANKKSQILNALTDAYLSLGRNDIVALQVYESVYSERQNDAILVNLMADTYLGSGSEKAIVLEVLQSAILLYPVKYEYHQRLACLYAKKDDQVKALETINLVPQEALSPECSILKGIIYYKSEMLDRALEVFRENYRKTPNDSILIDWLAKTLARGNDTSPESVSIIEKAHQGNPKELLFVSYLAQIYSIRGEITPALNFISLWEERSPNDMLGPLKCYEELSQLGFDIPIQICLMKAYLKAGFNDKALLIEQQLETTINDDIEKINLYQTYWDHNRENIEILIKKSVLQAENQMIDKAIKDIESLSSLDEQTSQLLENLYISKMQSDEENPIYHFKLGELLFKGCDYDRAIDCFQKSIKSSYNVDLSKYYLSFCLIRSGILDLASQILESLGIKDINLDAWYELGQKYLERKHLAKALNIFEKIMTEDVSYKDLKYLIPKIRDEISNGGGALTNTGQDTLIGTQVDNAELNKRYELVRELGRGNMGVVYLAHDRELDEPVALKYLPVELHNDAMIVERFKQEVRSTRRLSHPHIIRIFDLGEEEGRRFISMEYMEGKNLKEILQEKGKLSPLSVIDMGISVSSALDYAHRMKVVHRDIKPANIMISQDGQIKIMDFGIASMLERAGLTQTGAMIGTPLYMSPEQAEGRHVDGRADIYSMGVLFYELVVGNPPYSTGNISYQHVHVPPPQINDSDVPECLIEVIMKCLNKNPDHRYQTAGECQKALEMCREKMFN